MKCPQSTFLVRNTHTETVKEQVLCRGGSEARTVMIQKKLGELFFGFGGFF